MGDLSGIFTFLAILAVIIVICRALASAFPVIKLIASILCPIVAIIVWATNGFWWGLAALVGAFFVAGIFFNIGTDEEYPKTFKKSSYRPSNGLRCMNCGSTNTYKLDKSETEELCNLQYRVNHYGGTMKDAYKCTDCGYHMWYDRDGNLFSTHPKDD